MNVFCEQEEKVTVVTLEGSVSVPETEKFRDFMKMVVDMGLHEKCYILAGVTPMKNAGMANFMSKFVPGMDIPKSLVDRLKSVDKKDQAEEGIKFALEQVEEFKEMEGIAGVHMMAI